MQDAFKFKGEIIKYLQKLGMSYEDGEDVFSDILIKLSNYDRSDFTVPSKLKGFLYTSAYNTYVNVYRKQRRFEVVEIQSYHKSVSDSDAADTLANLPELKYEERLAILGVANGYTYEEIAAVLMLPVGTIKSKIHFARNKCRKHLRI